MGAISKVKRRVVRKLPKGIKGHTRVKVGFPVGKVDNQVMMKAIYNHFGTEETVKLTNGSISQSVVIPARPFLSISFDANASEYNSILRSEAKKILSDGKDSGLTMSKLGILAEGHVRTTITNLKEPANAASTIKKKGSSNPLVDSGEMKNATTHLTYA